MERPKRVAERSAAQEPDHSTSATIDADDDTDTKAQDSLNSSDSETNQYSQSKSRYSEDKKMNRILANRKSARKSRERRKKFQEELESSVTYLTNQNNALKQENNDRVKTVRLLTSLLNQATNQSLPGGASNNLTGTGVSQVASQLAIGGTMNQATNQSLIRGASNNLRSDGLSQATQLAIGGTMNQANNQSLIGGVSNSLMGTGLPQANRQFAINRATNTLSWPSSAPLTPAIDMNNIGVLQAIANLQQAQERQAQGRQAQGRQAQGRQVQGSTPNSDIIAALLDPSLRSTAAQQDQNTTIHLPPNNNRWGSS